MDDYEKIDTILNYFKNPPRVIINTIDISNHFWAELKQINPDEIGSILEKLDRDKFIYKNAPVQGYTDAYYYSLTFEGRLFEGYVKKKSDSAFEQNKAIYFPTFVPN